MDKVCHYTDPKSAKDIEENGLKPILGDKSECLDVVLDSTRPEDSDFPMRTNSVFFYPGWKCGDRGDKNIRIVVNTEDIPDDCKCAVGSNSETGGIESDIEQGIYERAIDSAESYWNLEATPCTPGDNCDEKTNELSPYLPEYERGGNPEIFCGCQIEDVRIHPNDKEKID